MSAQRAPAAAKATADAHDAVTLVDAHVHLHPGFELEAVLDAAASNFREALPPGRVRIRLVGVLLLAEMTGVDRFAGLLAQAAAGGADRAAWRLRPCADPEAVVASSADEATHIVIVAGRQIATREGLEVLALLTRSTFPERRPLGQTLGMVAESGALAVLPWGVGKWLGGRARLIRDAMRGGAATPVLLADSGVRPLFWPRPRLLREAEARGLPVLSGSDPFPCAEEARRIGSSWVMFSGALPLEAPVNPLRSSLREGGNGGRACTRLQGPVRFLRNQWAIRFHAAAPGGGA